MLRAREAGHGAAAGLPAQGRIGAGTYLDVAKIEGLEVLDEHFDAPGPNYHMNDSAMIEIHAQLDPTRPRGARRTRGT
jgi:hypothetical protein